MKTKRKKTTQYAMLTDKVIEYHALGYHLDFRITLQNQLLCIQNNLEFHPEQVSVELIDHIKGDLKEHSKEFYAVDTGSGERGVLIREALPAGNSPILSDYFLGTG